MVDAQTSRPANDLELALATVEGCLADLGEALKAHDSAATEAAASALHRALAQAVDRGTQAARRGGIAPPVRRRLAAAGGQVAALREAVARATASLDRSMEILLPDVVAARAPGYGDRGQAWRASSSGLAQA